MMWLQNKITNIITFFDRVIFKGDVQFRKQTALEVDPDKFLGIDTNGKVGYRTGAEVLSDIGASSTIGDITSVTAGTGLSGGGATGGVTLNVNASQTGVTVVGTLTELTVNNGESTTPIVFVLPTEDPGVVNRLYNDSGTIKISAGGE